MPSKNAKRTYIFMVIAAVSIGVAYGEVEIYKAGKRYDPNAINTEIPPQQANAEAQNLEIIRGKEQQGLKKPVAGPKIDLREVIEGAKQYLNKEQIEQLEKAFENENLEMGNYDISNLEKFSANYTN
jgi:hypothetical protein